MKVRRFLILIIFVWSLATLPWLLTKALWCGENWIKYSLIFGSINTLVVAIFLLSWSWIRNKFRIPSSGFSITTVYLVLTISVLTMGFIWQAKEPLIWEGIVPLIIMMCPISMFITAIPFIPFYLELILSICIGGIFYFLLGKIFDRFVLQCQGDCQVKNRCQNSLTDRIS